MTISKDFLNKALIFSINSLSGANRTEWNFTSDDFNNFTIDTTTKNCDADNVISCGLDSITIQLGFGSSGNIRTRQKIGAAWQPWSSRQSFTVPYFNSYDRYKDLNG